MGIVFKISCVVSWELDTFFRVEYWIVIEYRNVTGEYTCHNPQWRQQAPPELLLF